MADRPIEHTGTEARLSAAPDGPHRVPGSPSLLALYFDLPGLRLCLPLEHVSKVLALMALQEVPSAPRQFVGLLNLGGEAVPVVDLGQHLHRPAFLYHTDTPVVLCEVNGRRCGLIVESVRGVRPVSGRQQCVDEVVRDTQAPFLTVFDNGDGLVFVLDTETILADLLPA